MRIRPLLIGSGIQMSPDLWLCSLSADNERLSGMVIKQEAAAVFSDTAITVVAIQSNAGGVVESS